MEGSKNYAPSNEFNMPLLVKVVSLSANVRKNNMWLFRFSLIIYYYQATAVNSWT